MAIWSKTKRTWVGALSISLIWVATANAEAERNPQSPEPFNTALLVTPKGYIQEDGFYQTYFIEHDANLARSLQDEWQAVECDAFHNPQKQDRRNQIASRLLRLRIDNAIKVHVAQNSISPSLHRTATTLRRLESIPIRMSDRAGSGEFHVGYDAISDGFKLEYLEGATMLGLYQPHLIAGLSSPKANLEDELLIRFRTSPIRGLPSLSVNYRPTTLTVESDLTQAVNERITSHFLTTQNLNDITATRYELRFTYALRF